MAFTSAELPSLLLCLRPLPAREAAAPCCGGLDGLCLCQPDSVRDGLSCQPGWRVLASLALALDSPSLRVLVISGGRNSDGTQGESGDKQR